MMGILETVSLLERELANLRINYARGYRVYFKEKDGKIILLLVGGDKSTQQEDIRKAKEIWEKLKKQENGHFKI